jgi:hypothetical protein
MTKQIFTLRNALYGLVTWAVPFFAAFAFYTPEGQLATGIFLFKTVMILIGGVTGAWLLVRAFRQVTPSFASGLALGFFWAAINWGLDLIVMVAWMDTDPGEWFVGIGLRYLMLPIMAAGMGAVGAAQRG